MRAVKKYYQMWLDFDTYSIEIPYFEKPTNDNENLVNMQHDYLVNDDQQAFYRLWTSFTLLCLKAIKKEIRSKKMLLDRDTISYKADIACEYVLRRYQKYKVEKNTFYLIHNFVAEAYHGACHALYSPYENDRYFDECQKLDGKWSGYETMR